MKNKERLRKKFLNIRNSFGDEQVLLSSKQISNRFLSLDIVDISRNFLLYYSFSNEIVTYDIIDYLFKKDKSIYLPYINEREKELKIGRVYNSDNVKTGLYGIKEPVEKSDVPVTEMNVIVVPGLIFDKNGYRIGYGGGYYDRLLASINDKTVTIGLAYNRFLHETLPVESFDLPVKIIITEKQVLFIGGGKDESFRT